MPVEQAKFERLMKLTAWASKRYAHEPVNTVFFQRTASRIESMARAKYLGLDASWIFHLPKGQTLEQLRSSLCQSSK